MKEARVVWLGGDTSLSPDKVLKGGTSKESTDLTKLINEGWEIEHAVGEAQWEGFWLILIREGG